MGKEASRGGARGGRGREEGFMWLKQRNPVLNPQGQVTRRPEHGRNGVEMDLF